METKQFFDKEKFKKNIWRNIAICMAVFGLVGVAFSADEIKKAVRTGDPSRIGAADASTGVQLASLPWSGALAVKSDFQKIREKVERDGYFQSEQRGNVIYFRPLYGKAGEIKNGMDDIKAGRVFQGVVLRGADFNSLIGAINQCKPTDKLCQTGAYGAMLETLANKEGQIIAISDPSEFLSIRIRNLIENKKLSKARELLPTMVTEAEKQATGNACAEFEKIKAEFDAYKAQREREGGRGLYAVGLEDSAHKAERNCLETRDYVAAAKWEAEGYEAIILAMDGEDEKALALAHRTLDAELVPFLQAKTELKIRPFLDRLNYNIPAYRAFERVIVTIAELSVKTKRGVFGIAMLEKVVDGFRNTVLYTSENGKTAWSSLSGKLSKQCNLCIDNAINAYHNVFENTEIRQG